MAHPLRRFWLWFKGTDPRQVYSDQATIVGVYQPPLAPPTDAEALAETEQDNPTIGRAVDVIARDAASVPLQLTRRKNQGKTREVIQTHPALDVLKWINQVDTPNIWWQSVYADLLTYGDHFSWVQIDEDGAHNILRLPAQSMKPIPSKKNIIGGYEWTDSHGATRQYAANEIIHLKTRNPNSIYRGMSLLERLRGTILLEREMRKWNYARFRNNVPSTLIIKTKKMISNEAEMSRLMDHVHRKMAGSENAGRPFVINSDETEIDYLPRPTEEELAYITGLKLNRSEIATVFGVPPSELMDFSDAFRANAKEQGRAYWEATIMGWHRLTLEWLNTVWLPRFFEADADLEFVYDYSAVRALGFSAFEMAQVNEILVRSGIRTPNEARHAMGDDEYQDDSADKLYVSGRPLGSDPFGLLPGIGDTANPEAEPSEADPEEHMNDAMRNVLPLRPLLKDFNPGDLFDEAEEVRRLRARVEQVIGEMVRVAGEQQLVVDGIEGVFNVNDPAVLEMVQRQSIKVTEDVISTTVSNVRQTVAEVLASGAPTDISAVRAAIQDAYNKRKEPWQLKRISRTEAHQAQEGAGYHSASQNGVEFKRWLSARDSDVRTEPEEKRSDHAAMDGQTVPIDARFEDPKSHARLMYPGDADGATRGHDVINCRCTWISVIPDDDGIVRRFVDHDEAWLKKHTTRSQFERALEVLFLAHLDDMESRTLERLEQARRNVA